MTRSLLIGMLALGLGACANGAAEEAGASGGSAARSLGSGTRINATMDNTLSSANQKAGETVRATVTSNITDARGAVVIPAGSTVTLKIDQLETARDQGRPEGQLSLVVSSITVNGRATPVSATLVPVAHTLEGRGIGKAEAARVGVGTAVGAGVGQVIGKDTKSTIIGGAIGAVAGSAVAVRYAERDIVVAAGTPIVFTLSQSFTAAK